MVARGLQRGATLSHCLSQFPECFSELQVTLVRVGERSGALGQVFARLAQQEEQLVVLQQRLRGALLMPLFITGFCIGLLFLVAPLMLGSVLQQMGLEYSQLPWMTRMLVSLASLLRNPFCWILVVVGLLTAVGVWRRHGRSRVLAAWLDRIPGLGPTFRLYGSLRFVRILENTLNVGVPLLACLEMAGSGSGHPLLKQAMPQIIGAVKGGHELHEALAASRFFTGAAVQNIQAGQESGSLVKSLQSLARFQEIELNYACDTFTQLLEPLVMAVVGALVGFCVIATVLPLSQLVDSL